MSNQERFALEDDLKNVMSDFIKINHTRLLLKLALLEKNLKYDRNLGLESLYTRPSTLLQFVGYLSADFCRAAHYFYDLHNSLKKAAINAAIDNHRLGSELPHIRKVAASISYSIENHKRDIVRIGKAAKIATEQATQTDFINQSERGTQIENIEFEDESINCNLPMDKISKDKKTVETKDCATSCKLTLCDDVEKTQNSQ